MKLIKNLAAVLIIISMAACQKELTFEEGPSDGTLKADTTGNCIPGSVSGAFVRDSLLEGVGGSNYIDVQVTVNTAGSYVVYTDTVNGYSFKREGSVGNTGTNLIRLYGSGRPIQAQIDTFTVYYGTTHCTVRVEITGTPVVLPNLDYIPQTSLSNWTYQLEGGTAADTFFIRINPNPFSQGGHTYNIFEELDNGSPQDSTMFRKAGGVYFSLYNNSLVFDNNFDADVVVLDSNNAVNFTWTANLGSNLLSGNAVNVFIADTLIDKVPSVTLGSETFNNVIKVTYTYKFTDVATPTNFITFYREEMWYAKGIGMIRLTTDDLATVQTYNLIRWHIN